MKTEITKEMLYANGFKKAFMDDYLKQMVGEDYCEVEYKTVDEYPLLITMENRFTNREGAIWRLHIDNDKRSTIGSADITYVEQFNMMMQIFDSNFKL